MLAVLLAHFCTKFYRADLLVTVTHSSGEPVSGALIAFLAQAQSSNSLMHFFVSLVVPSAQTSDLILVLVAK